MQSRKAFVTPDRFPPLHFQKGPSERTSCSKRACWRILHQTCLGAME